MPVLLEVVGCQYGIAINLLWLAINDRVGQQGNEQHIHRVYRIVFEFLQVVNINCVHFTGNRLGGFPETFWPLHTVSRMGLRVMRFNCITLSLVESLL
jgi:hypothetical protein